jgi:dTDP-4-dehydrorhamnose 3,5-epimerase
MGEYAHLVQHIDEPALTRAPIPTRNGGRPGRAEMNITETAMPGVLIVEPKLFGDVRGFFQELYHQGRYAEHGIAVRFVQDNLSRSARGVLRGLHLQNPRPQGKLVTVLRGAVLDVAVDARVGSPTVGRHVAVELSEDNRRQLWIPRGFAHGFVVRSESADFFYKCDDLYSPADEIVLAWDDPQLGIDWGCDAPSLSARDRQGATLAALASRLPRYGSA